MSGSIWNFIVYMFWIYIFVAYLVVLYQIISDLFRDRDLNGWVKAVWFAALLFFPILTALVYLIARGRGMAERHGQRVRQAQGETEAYIQSVAGRSNPAEQISSAKALLDAGTITQPEFEQMKAKALASA